MVLLIWSTLTFAAAVVTYSWFGINENVLNANAGGDSNTPLADARFRGALGWVASGTLIWLVIVVMVSLLYFWRVSRAVDLFVDRADDDMCVW